MTENMYLTTLNTRPFLYAATIIVAKLLHQGKTYDEIEKIVIQENLFELNSEDRAERFCNEILKRLEELDIFLFNQFLVTDLDTRKAILFYALLKKDHLFYEWTRDIVWDKFLVLDWNLSRKETEAFFEKKSLKNRTVRSWTPETKSLLMDAYHRVLNEVGMAKTDGDEIQLQRLDIDYHIREYLIDRKELEIVEVVLGELVG